MIELIQAIAMLCNFQPSQYYYNKAKKDSLKCQQEYIKCVDKKDRLNYSYGLKMCILEKKKY
jgi:hypothetical protein